MADKSADVWNKEQLLFVFAGLARTSQYKKALSNTDLLYLQLLMK